FMCESRKEQVLVAIGLARRVFGHPASGDVANHFQNHRRLIGSALMNYPMTGDDLSRSIPGAMDQFAFPLSLGLQLGLDVRLGNGKFSLEQLVRYFAQCF